MASLFRYCVENYPIYYVESIESMCKAVADWQGFGGNQRIIKRIHGENDKIIACHSKCKTIESGGHLIAITHAHECIEIIH